MANPLRRVSRATEAAVLEVSEREDRNFIVQLDRVVAAGLHALGEAVPDDLKTYVPTKARPKAKTKT